MPDALPTPRLDALIAKIESCPRREVPGDHGALLARTLPGDVRRLVQALAEHRIGFLSVGLDFELDDNTLGTTIPPPHGDDLIVIGWEGGGNWYAFENTDTGAQARLYLVVPRDDFERYGKGTLEVVFERSAKAQELQDAEDGEDA